MVRNIVEAYTEEAHLRAERGRSTLVVLNGLNTRSLQALRQPVDWFAPITTTDQYTEAVTRIDGFLAMIQRLRKDLLLQWKVDERSVDEGIACLVMQYEIWAIAAEDFAEQAGFGVPHFDFVGEDA